MNFCLAIKTETHETIQMRIQQNIWKKLRNYLKKNLEICSIFVFLVYKHNARIQFMIKNILIWIFLFVLTPNEF